MCVSAKLVSLSKHKAITRKIISFIQFLSFLSYFYAYVFFYVQDNYI